MGNCNCGSNNNVEAINKVNEEVLTNNAIESQIKEAERRIKAAEAKYKNTMEQIEIMRSKNEVISNMIEIEQDRKNENERKLEALIYSLMKHGVTQESMDEAKAGKGYPSSSSEVQNKTDAGKTIFDDDDDDDDDMGPYSLLEMFDIAKVLDKFSKELEVIKANQGVIDDVAIANDDVQTERTVKNNDKNSSIDSSAEGTDAAPSTAAVPPIPSATNNSFSMVSWFLREELDENGYPSLVTLMSYNRFKEIILSHVNASNFTPEDAELLAVRFSDENMVDVVEFIEYFETTLEERIRASAFNLMQLVPGKIKFPPYLLPTPPGAATTDAEGPSSSSLELGSTVDYHQCSKLEFAANKLYMIFDSVAEKLEEELHWAAEKNIAASSRVKTEEFQQILVDFCSVDKVDPSRMSTTSNITLGDFHKVPYISKTDAVLLSERFTFGNTGYVDYKVFMKHFKEARSLDMGLRGTPYDVRVTAVPPPSPRRNKKSDKEAIAVPEDNSKLDIEPKGTETTGKSNSNDNDTIPVSEEKSPIKSEESSAKLLSAKASSKSIGKPKSTKKKKKKESKESKEAKNVENVSNDTISDPKITKQDDNNNNAPPIDTNADTKIMKQDDDNATSAPPLTIVTSPTALKDSDSPPSLTSPNIKSPVSASSVATSVDIEDLLEHIRAMMEEQHDVDSVEATFKKFDKNSDGVLHKEEMKSTLDELNIPVSAADIQAIFDVFDKDKNGTIDYNEFIDVLCEM